MNAPSIHNMAWLHKVRLEYGLHFRFKFGPKVARIQLEQRVEDQNCQAGHGWVGVINWLRWMLYLLWMFVVVVAWPVPTARLPTPARSTLPPVRLTALFRTGQLRLSTSKRAARLAKG